MFYYYLLLLLLLFAEAAPTDNTAVITTSHYVVDFTRMSVQHKHSKSSTAHTIRRIHTIAESPTKLMPTEPQSEAEQMGRLIIDDVTVETVPTNDVVRLFERIFFTSKAEATTKADSSEKILLVPRSMCMWCGRVFPSRAKLFHHLQSNPIHDTTPEVACEVMRLCLRNRLDKASTLLWGSRLKAESVLFTVSLFFSLFSFIYYLFHEFPLSPFSISFFLLIFFLCSRCCM
jgi:hypothetical protein